MHPVVGSINKLAGRWIAGVYCYGITKNLRFLDTCGTSVTRTLFPATHGTVLCCNLMPGVVVFGSWEGEVIQDRLLASSIGIFVYNRSADATGNYDMKWREMANHRWPGDSVAFICDMFRGTKCLTDTKTQVIGRKHNPICCQFSFTLLTPHFPVTSLLVMLLIFTVFSAFPNFFQMQAKILPKFCSLSLTYPTLVMHRDMTPNFHWIVLYSWY